MDSDTPFGVPYIAEIVPNLWQGGYRREITLPEFIKNIVCLYPDECYTTAPGVGRYTFAMEDSIDQTFELVDEIAELVNRLRKEAAVFVHCQAGINRSALIVCRALMLEGMSADEAIALIREKRSMGCLSNPMFEAWLRGAE